MKTFIKKNIRFIIIVVICITCSVLTTFATTTLFNSSEVYYNNTTSGIQADKVQGAIDELYACASNYAAYNQRLTSAENTIGSGSFTTTSQNLIGAVNEVNGKVVTIDTGTANSGTYIKFSNGIMITYQRYSIGFEDNGTWGSMYVYTITGIKNFPASFTNVPTISVTYEVSGRNGWIVTQNENGKPSTTSPGAYQLVRPSSTNMSTGQLHVIAYGKWK